MNSNDSKTSNGGGHPAAASTIARAMLHGFLAVLCGVAPVVRAAEITVTTLVDEFNDDGDCSLREAIESANGDFSVDLCAAGSGADEIVFLGSLLPGTVVLDGGLGELAVTADLTISGPGATDLTIDGAGGTRLLRATGAISLALSGLRLTNGAAAGDGGAVFADPEVLLTVDSCTIDGNVATGDGGGIRCGQLHLSGSVVTENDARSGGGIHATGDFNLVEESTIVDTRVTHNDAEFGGGVLLTDGLWSIENSSFELNNATTGCGGGLHHFGRLSIVDSSFYANGADCGGAILADIAARTDIRNSSLIFNAAFSGSGGALFNQGIATLSNVTVARNSALDASAITSSPCCLFEPAGVSMRNTILADNREELFPGDELQNCLGEVISLGHNMVGELGACLYTPSPTDVPQGLYSDGLFDDGTPGGRHILLRGDSPAVDAGDNFSCPALDPLGNVRPLDGDADLIAGCDIGAVEFAKHAALTPSERRPAAGSRVAACAFLDFTNETQPAGSYGATLTWDPALLDFVGATGGDPPFDAPVLNTDNTAAGELSFADADATGATGEIHIACFEFDVVGAADSTPVLDLELTSLFTAETFVDLLPEAVVVDARLEVVTDCTVGDANADVSINSGDALLVLSNEVELPVPPAVQATLAARCGDANGDTRTDSIDANVILSSEVGLPIDPGFPLAASNQSFDDCPVCTTVPCVPVPADLVSWWDGDATSGPTAFDIAGDNDGTLNGIGALAPGPVGLAFHFMGTGAIHVPDDPTLDISDQLTVAAWVNIDSSATEQQFLSKGFDSWELLMFPAEMDDPAAWYFRYVIGGGFDEIACFDVDPGTWTHLAAVYDGSRTRLYKDGVECASAEASGPIGLTDEPLLIGRGQDGFFFEGLLDEIQIFDRALGQAEIVDLVEAPNAALCQVEPAKTSERIAGSRAVEPALARVAAVRTGKGLLELTLSVELGKTSGRLGSYGAAVSWDPGALLLVDAEGGATPGFGSPVLNLRQRADGRLRASAANPKGAAGSVEILRLRFRESGEKKLSAEALARLIRVEFTSLGGTAPYFEDLLPRLRVEAPTLVEGQKPGRR